MKRLLSISLDLALLSFIPILSWLLLGIILDANLINVFTITYPLQYIYYIIKAVFSTGANINKERDRDKGAVMSGLVIGSIISFLIFLCLVLNVDSYITFMNMDADTYRVFTIYSIIQIFLSLEFSILLDKLYFEEKDILANKYSVIFNLMSFILLIGLSLITKNQVIIVMGTLIPLAIFTIAIIVKNSNKLNWKLDILKCIEYDSIELFNNISYLLIFLFGLSITFNYGSQYAMAIAFIVLITDMQCDTLEAISTLAIIDISKKEFNYKEAIKNAYKLLGILFISILIMFSILYWFYDLNILITLSYLLFEIINFILYPISSIKTYYLQLEWSALKTTTNRMLSLIIRFIITLIKNPFCTGIGQVCSSIYQYITVTFIFERNYKVTKNGIVKTLKETRE